MIELAKIDDELVTGDDFIKFLKFNGKFNALLEDFLGHKLTVHVAQKSGVNVTEDETQKRADQYRRIFGLHRSKDMLEHLEELGVSLEEFGRSLEENIIHETIISDIQSEQAVEDYFTLNSPKYESVELSSILIDSEGKTQEIMALLEDDPDCFAELAKEHSVAADAVENGGSLGKVYRDTLVSEIEAKVFNAKAGDILGPFTDDDEFVFEIFLVTKKYPAECDAEIKKKIQKLLYDNWLASKMSEHRIDIL
jgi:parvulin-like peptidyl-prolyl isomerase